ncbi:hypothetical protein T07_6267 [Trichinella nelsoni]|uniref:Uncharacterized protein n=1 Tax=Trichinella nelsoni TaxID=6336 RepID=A0A0V0RW00_9BILA|nr:hypothetical protein T07_6267 [Trichinella nelsoni]
MKSRIIVLDKARLDSKKVLKGVCFFAKWLIYNVLCCVREVTFPKVSIQFLKKKSFTFLVSSKLQSSAKSAVYKMWQFTCQFRKLTVENDEIWQHVNDEVGKVDRVEIFFLIEQKRKMESNLINLLLLQAVGNNVLTQRMSTKYSNSVFHHLTSAPFNTASTIYY